MRNNKAQIKMMETISVLIVFIIIIVFMMIFYINISSSSNNVAKEDETNQKAVELAQKVSFLPEFQCSSKNIVIDNCFDIFKLDSFIYYVNYDSNGQISQNTTYYDMFEYGRVVIGQIYPSTNQTWEIYDNKPPYKRYDEKTSFIPIALYEPNKKETYFGLLNVTIYR